MATFNHGPRRKVEGKKMIDEALYCSVMCIWLKAVRPVHLPAVSVAHAGANVGVTRVLSTTLGASSHTCFHRLLFVMQVPSIMSGWTATKRPISRVS